VTQFSLSGDLSTGEHGDVSAKPVFRPLAKDIDRSEQLDE
jgi:hypothetical protein